MLYVYLEFLGVLLIIITYLLFSYYSLVLQVCCICLAKYAHNDELRELPCAHCFHKDCVDKWLKINALCPLCKSEIAGSSGTSDARQSDQNAIPVQEIEMR